MNIRLAVYKDLDRAMNLIRSCTEYMNEQGIHQWDENYPDIKTIRRDIGFRHLHLLERNDTILGLIVLNEDQAPEYLSINWHIKGRALVVHRLAIDPSYQKQSLARRLMEFAYRYAEAGDYQAIRLDTFINNPIAVKLYEGLGYRKAGTVTFPKGNFFCFERAVNRAK